jgi:4-amino-4-deoxy-L-arabinose transferase-like glycosyltransferase
VSNGGLRNRVVLGVVLSLATISLGYVAYVELGAMTGVLAMCATAPQWWASTYVLIGISVRIIAVWAGIHVARRHRSSARDSDKFGSPE